MKTTLLPLVALPASLVCSGCATKALFPPDAVLRDSLGSICIVAETNVDRIRFQVPDSKADIAAERLLSDGEEYQKVSAAAVKAVGDPRLASVGLAGAIVIVGGAPLWQEMRRGVGLLVADSASQVATARSTMDAAVTGVHFEEELRQRLATELAARAPNVLQAASPRSAHTILELMVYEPAITGNEGINPGLALHLGLRVRLLDARTRGELYYDYLDYRSSSHTLVKWAAEDAKILQAELERCLARLSNEVVAQLFLRPSTEPASRTALAAGLSRRPPQPLSASAAYAHRPLPVFNPPVYVFNSRR